jgi:hypothetical protein
MNIQKGNVPMTKICCTRTIINIFIKINIHTQYLVCEGCNPTCRIQNQTVTRLVNDGGTTECRGWFSAFTGDWYCKGVGVSVAVADVCGTSIAP